MGSGSDGMRGAYESVDDKARQAKKNGGFIPFSIAWPETALRRSPASRLPRIESHKKSTVAGLPAKGP